MATTSGALRQVTKTGMDGAPAWTVDGRLVIARIAKDRFTFNVVNTANGQARLLVSGRSFPLAGRDKVLKLSSNENPLGCSDKARAAYAAAAADLHRYPNTDHAPLRRAIGQVHGLDPDRIICGVGSDGVLQFVVHAFAGTGDQVGLEALLSAPPDLLVTAMAPDYPSLATDMLRHPAVAGLPRRVVAPALLICGGPFTVEAAERLAR